MTFKNTQLEQSLLEALEQSLIVSCQPVPDSPMDRDDIVLAMAQAAVAGGAKGLRIEGAKRVRLVAQHCNVPIVGIIKRDLTESEVRITPSLEDVKALADAGARIIAFDGTDRLTACLSTSVTGSYSSPRLYCNGRLRRCCQWC